MLCVIWRVLGPIDGIGDAFKALKTHGKNIVCVSNNSVRETTDYMERLRNLSPEANVDDVIHPAVSVVRYLKSINFQGPIYAIVSAPFLAILREAGYEVFTGPKEPLPETFREVMQAIANTKPAKAVIVDYDYNCNNPKLMKAEQYLRADSECLFIAGAVDNKMSVSSSYSFFGPGRYVELLEKATGRKATVLGKPSHLLGEQLKMQYSVGDARRVLFVGDMIDQDVAFGKITGFQTLLVLTGGTSKADLESLRDSGKVPDFYTESIADFAQIVEDVLAGSKKACL
ncbi:uncharacterized protein LOC129767534 isoform X2 [Toxorhynchites rutilus septentrionalis]|uniref:uncharacterized protein LOC129767534 isoform X2 n=1 Tax=Toxorhynchites rutilus septentrionalis TaxID=329112 RepID=UPI0024787195|nr:uncharacterized protein LOC129767534 isoform X2 [Toxorhynchites rutilus septentrionalis]